VGGNTSWSFRQSWRGGEGGNWGNNNRVAKELARGKFGEWGKKILENVQGKTKASLLMDSPTAGGGKKNLPKREQFLPVRQPDKMRCFEKIESVAK